MAKVKAGKVKTKKYFGEDQEANLVLHAYKAAKKLEWQRKKDSRWQLAAAAGADRFLLIAKPQR